MIGLSEKTIRRKLDTGELKAEKRGNVYAIRIKDLDKLVTGQGPTTPDLLLQRIKQLEAEQERQASQINALEQRIQELVQPTAYAFHRETRREALGWAQSLERIHGRLH